jgi:hypothetical protein
LSFCTFFIWSLCCLSFFDLRILHPPLVYLDLRILHPPLVYLDLRILHPPLVYLDLRILHPPFGILRFTDSASPFWYLQTLLIHLYVFLFSILVWLRNEYILKPMYHIYNNYSSPLSIWSLVTWYSWYFTTCILYKKTL